MRYHGSRVGDIQAGPEPRKARDHNKIFWQMDGDPISKAKPSLVCKPNGFRHRPILRLRREL